MKKSYLTIALTLTVLFGAGLSAHAQDPDAVVVKVPFEFFAGASTLPAGTYTIGRTSPGASSGLNIRGDEHSAFVLPSDADSVPGGPPKLSFEHVGGKYCLSTVETPERIYKLHTSPEMIKLGQMKGNNNMPLEGGN
jgi:hypothetical protein